MMCYDSSKQKPLTMKNYKHSDLTRRIIRAAMNVHNYLGYGFAESVYENALMIELEEMGLNAKQQCPIQVFYKTRKVGDFVADIIVNDLVIVELKAVSELHKKHEVQVVNYLRATPIEVGLLLNFSNEDLDFKRKAFSNSRKVNQNRIPPQS